MLPTYHISATRMACLMRVQIDLHAPVFKQSPIDDLYALAAKAVSLLGEPGNNAGHSLLAQPLGCLSALARRPMRTIALIARRGGFIFISLIAVPLLRVGQRNTPSPFPSSRHSLRVVACLDCGIPLECEGRLFRRNRHSFNPLTNTFFLACSRKAYIHF